jgi:hypothetical protein
MEETDNVSAIEASLIESLAQEDVDEISAYETYAALIHEGRTLDEVARIFGKTDRQVTQSLAVANLLSRIRDLYREDGWTRAICSCLTGRRALPAQYDRGRRKGAFSKFPNGRLGLLRPSESIVVLK